MNKRLWCALLACLLLCLPLQSALCLPRQALADAPLALQSLPDTDAAPVTFSRRGPVMAAPAHSFQADGAVCLACARAAICVRAALRGPSILALTLNHPRLAPPSQR
ncbi:MAG: hypothetical protein PHY12_04125 [Eubacteriales bacterium]|nr:hypothetical protein [Eubacteriales bacterium]